MFTFWFSVALAAGLFEITGNGGSQSHACSAGEAVKLNGSNHTVTLTGDCGALTVIGDNNKITVDGLTGATVTGSSNDITYARNLSGKKKLPATLVGIGNKVHQ